MHNKLEYWQRRKEGLRGQTNPLSKRGLINPSAGLAKVGNKPVSNKALRKNTKRARKANNVSK